MGRSRSGFTLMEATLAVAVLAIGAMGLAGVFSQIVKANGMAGHKQVCGLLAGAELTRLAEGGWSGVTRTQGTFGSPFEQYQWQAQVRTHPDRPGIADLWVEVRHVSGMAVTVWTQMRIKDDQ